MITLKQVSKTYGRPPAETKVLREIDLQFNDGDFTFVLGPSGSGKSTLLYLIAGLEPATSGAILYNDRPVKEMSQRELNRLRQNEIGFIFQSFNLLQTLNCVDNVLVPFLPAGTSRQRRSEAIKLLEQVGLKHRMHHRPNELSGGEQQRVAVARALLKKPKLVLADEPTGELDSATGAAIFGLLRELNESQQTTVITVTHDHRYLTENDRILHMEDGRFIDAAAT